MFNRYSILWYYSTTSILFWSMKVYGSLGQSQKVDLFGVGVAIFLKATFQKGFFSMWILHVLTKTRKKRNGLFKSSPIDCAQDVPANCYERKTCQSCRFLTHHYAYTLHLELAYIIAISNLTNIHYSCMSV